MDDPKTISEEGQWQLDARAFLKNVILHWFGIASTICGCGAIAFWTGVYPVTAAPLLGSIFAIASGIAFMVGCFREWRDERRAKEKALVEVAKFIEQQKSRLEISDGGFQDNGAIRGFLIRITNSSTTDVKNCQVRLVGISRGDQRWVCNDHLTFEPSETDPLARDLTAGNWQRVNVIFLAPDTLDKIRPGTRLGDDGLHVWNHGYKFREALSEHGIYILSVIVSAEGLSKIIERNLRFTYFTDRAGELEVMPATI